MPIVRIICVFVAIGGYLMSLSGAGEPMSLVLFLVSMVMLAANLLVPLVQDYAVARRRERRLRGW